MRKITNEGFRPKADVLGNTAGARILDIQPNEN